MGEIGTRGRAGAALGESEVEHLHLLVGCDLHIARLEVAVDDPALVRRLDRQRDLAAEIECPLERQRPARDALGQRLALNVLERQEPMPALILFDPVDSRDVGWLSDATSFASRSKRASRSGSAANSAGRTFRATRRSSRGSRPR